MIRFLNFLYKGFAFADPRFGAKELFWMTVFSLALVPVDIFGPVLMTLISGGNSAVILMIISFLVRLVPLYYVKPLTGKRFAAIYVVEKKRKYWFNAIVAFFMCVFFAGFQFWFFVLVYELTN